MKNLLPRKELSILLIVIVIILALVYIFNRYSSPVSHRGVKIGDQKKIALTKLFAEKIIWIGDSSGGYGINSEKQAYDNYLFYHAKEWRVVSERLFLYNKVLIINFSMEDEVIGVQTTLIGNY